MTIMLQGLWIVLFFCPFQAFAKNLDVGIDHKCRSSTNEGPGPRSDKDMPLPEPLSTTERTTAEKILNEPGGSPERRCEWYKDKIGRFAQHIREAARSEKIPPRLLASIVLNELADVGWGDVIQDQQLAGTHGNYEKYETAVLRVALWWKSIARQSVGIAQISPQTVIRHHAVRVPGEKFLTRKNELEFHIAYRLLNRQVAISAAAKVIRGIIRDIERHQNCKWVKQFIRPGCRFSVERPYEALFPGLGQDGRVTEEVQREREMKLAQLVAAVYNSGNILTPRKGQRVPNADASMSRDFSNALKLGHNTAYINGDLFEKKGCGMDFEPDGCGEKTP